jgi:Undecaprenyl-phosphate galactose phosphotransferase WbaP
MTNEEFFPYYKKHFHHTSSFLSGLVLMIVDAFALMLCIGISFFIINSVNNSFINFRSFVTYSVYLPLILIVFYAAGLYPGIMSSPAEDVKRICVCTFFSFVGIAISIFVEDNEDKIAVAIALVLAVPIATLLLPTGREVARQIFGRHHWWGVPAVIYCTGHSGDTIINRLIERPDLGYKPAVIINSGAFQNDTYCGIPVFAPGSTILALIKNFNIKVAILCDYKADISDIMKSYRYTISVSKTQDMLSTGTLQLKDIGGIIGFSSVHNLTKKGNLFAKRVLDIVLIIISFPVVFPLCIVISILVKITSPGPVFYGHVRVGKNRQQLKCWKFRSMYRDADKQLDKILSEDTEMAKEWEKERKFTDDPRVTKLGRFLRKTSLDELPQLWNILLGQMSFVGPRPVTEGELIKYGSNADYILSVTPGLSGMWQTSGRSDTEYEERITLDTYYIQNWSFWLDLWIVIKTVWVVFKGKGAY